MHQHNRTLQLILTFALCATLSFAQTEDDDDDLFLIEIEGFEVFSNSMKIIDGATGKEYDGSHPVVLGFRREFDDVLSKYHRKLLSEEYKRIKLHTETIKPFIADIDELATSFGMKGFEVEGPHLTREIAIFRRMVNDPFFKIKELVVWDQRALNNDKDLLPATNYGKNIRFDEESGKWERRVTTKWEVSFTRSNQQRTPYYNTKEQGLNLDTHMGYHIVDKALPEDVTPRAFKMVELEYPVIITNEGSTESQIQELKRDFIINLIYLYDPFSWVGRGNTRFRRGFRGPLLDHIKSQRLNLKDRDWFDKVFSQFLNNIVIAKYWGSDEIYDTQMLLMVRKNRNQLGEDLDLLNWLPKEKRQVDYDPNQPVRVPRINLKNPGVAHYILLDAYRRYGESFLESLRKRILNIEEKADPKQLIKDAIEEASGVSADKYIPAAIKAQQAELERFLRK